MTEITVSEFVILKKEEKKPAGIAQSVERRALGHEVLGSNLASASYSRSDIGQSLQQ